MNPTLYEHQTAGAAWLADRARGYLGDTPGLGKTRTLLAALPDTAGTLVVCPAIVRTHWQREAGVMERNIIVRSYEEITRGGVDLMKELVPNVDALVLDEAHYLKHGTSQRAKMLLGKDGYARRLPLVYLASGTPMPRNPAELWTVIASLFPESAVKRGLRTRDDFVKRYCIVRGSYVRGAWREKVIGIKPEMLDDLRELLGEFMLRRALDDVGLDVPRIDWQVTRLDSEDWTYLDKELWLGGLNDPFGMERDIRHDTLGINMDALRAAMDEPHVARMRRRLGELKAPLVVSMLREQLEADPTMRVAVFAHHRSVLATLAQGFSDSFSYIDGDTSERARQDEIEKFQQGRTRVFIGQNIACSTGMDGLQHATNRAVLVEPDWTPDVNYQLGHRVARIGAAYNGRAVVQMIALAGTLDEAIIGQNARETRMVDAAMSRKEAA